MQINLLMSKQITFNNFHDKYSSQRRAAGRFLKVFVGTIRMKRDSIGGWNVLTLISLEECFLETINIGAKHNGDNLVSILNW